MNSDAPGHPASANAGATSAETPGVNRVDLAVQRRAQVVGLQLAVVSTPR